MGKYTGEDRKIWVSTLEKTEKYREVHWRRQKNMGKYTGEDRKIWELHRRRQNSNTSETWKGRSTGLISVALGQMTVSGQLHVPVALPLGKDTSLTIEQEVWWAQHT